MTHTISTRKIIRVFQFLYGTDAPWLVFKNYFKTYLLKKYRPLSNSALHSFRVLAKSGDFSNDWFTGNIPLWEKNIQALISHQGKREFKALEIGSWEGLSSLFMMSNLPISSLTCVDTWEGADEHQGTAAVLTIENKFDHNLKNYSSKIKKFKGTSYQFFNQSATNEKYDLIYVDGSHFSDDVMIDAIKAFEHLNIGGVLIFDDFLWIHYKNLKDNPAGAINSFLRLKKNNYTILSVDYQLTIQKISEGRQPLV